MKSRRSIRSPRAAESWADALLQWYDANRRDLPWRHNPTPYETWISEAMLQQTRVETVIPYYHRFLQRFPTVDALASASEEEVLKLWEGLGYYARARNLLRAAGIIVREHAGKVPAASVVLKDLPGIGSYAAAAIASIAAGERVPVLDGNVGRVMSRLLAIAIPVTSGKARGRILTELEKTIPATRPGDFNQAMMELGAVLCKPRQPDCAACPIRGVCLSHARGITHRIPVRAAVKTIPRYRVAAAVVVQGGSVLISRRTGKAMLGGLWEFPGRRLLPKESGSKVLPDLLLGETGLQIGVKRRLCSVRQTYSHFGIELQAYLCSPLGEHASRLRDGLRWVRFDRLRSHPFGKAARDVIERFLAVPAETRD